MLTSEQMLEMVEGTRCRVLADSLGKFELGSIVSRVHHSGDCDQSCQFVDSRGVSNWMNPHELELVVEEAGAASAHFTTEPVALTGGSVDYYKFMVEDPTTADAPYFIEVNDLIEAAGMNFAEGNIVKAIARIAGIRNGKGKPGVTGVYDAEKVVFFGDRVLKQQQRLAAN